MPDSDTDVAGEAAAGMTREQAHDALDGVAEAMAAQFADQPDRLHQLTSHLATAGMAVDHLFDHSGNTAAERRG